MFRVIRIKPFREFCWYVRVYWSAALSPRTNRPKSSRPR